MERPFRRGVWLAALVVGVTMPLDAVIYRALSLPTMPERAASWAASLTDEERSAYIRSDDLPAVYYTALRKSLTPSGAAMVLEHKIRNYRSAHPDLDSERSAFLDTVEQFLSSGTAYGVDAAAGSKNQLLALATEARRLFPSDDEQLALFVIERPAASGAPKEPTLLNQAAGWLLNVVPGSTVSADANGEECDCAIDSDWCGSGSHCCDTSGCTVISEWYWDPGLCFPQMGCWIPGCGTMLAYPCDGWCFNPI